MITSLNNSKIKHLCELQTKKRTRIKEGVFVVEGFRIFEEVPNNLIKEIYFEEGTCVRNEIGDKAPSSHLMKTFEKIEKCRQNGIFVEELSHEVFKKASDTDSPQGVICVVKMPQWQLKDIIANIPKGSKGNLLILEDIQDPGNLGTMVRTAEAAGISGIIMSEGCVDIFNPKTVRSTMGSVFRVPTVYVSNLPTTLETVKRAGIKLYAASLKAKGEYDRIEYEGRSGILIGNEGNGLSQEVMNQADIGVIIPMQGQIESLNASVAAALMMYICR